MERLKQCLRDQGIGPADIPKVIAELVGRLKDYVYVSLVPSRTSVSYSGLQDYEALRSSRALVLQNFMIKACRQKVEARG